MNVALETGWADTANVVANLLPNWPNWPICEQRVEGEGRQWFFPLIGAGRDIRATRGWPTAAAVCLGSAGVMDGTRYERGA